MVKANEAAVRLFRLRRPLDRPHLSQLYHPDGFPPLADFCHEALHLGRPTRKNVFSNRTLYRLRCAPFSNQEGQLRGATLTLGEVDLASDRPTAGGGTNPSDALFFMHRLPDGTLLDLSCENVEALFGHPSGNVLGGSLSEFLQDHSYERTLAQDRQFLEGPRSFEASLDAVSFLAASEVHEVLTYRFRTPGPDDAEAIFAVSWALPA